MLHGVSNKELKYVPHLTSGHSHLDPPHALEIGSHADARRCPSVVRRNAYGASRRIPEGQRQTSSFGALAV